MGGSGLTSLLFFLAFGLFLYWMMKKSSCGMHGHGGYDQAGYGRDDSAGSGGGGAAPPIALCIGGEVCEFVGGTTRVFRLNDDAADGASQREATAASHLKDPTTERTLS